MIVVGFSRGIPTWNVEYSIPSIIIGVVKSPLNVSSRSITFSYFLSALT